MPCTQFRTSLFLQLQLARVSTRARLWKLEGGLGLRRTDLGWTLIQRSPAVLGPTQTGDLNVLYGELVVVRDLLVHVDGLPGVDHDLLLRLHRDDFRITVGLEKTNKRHNPKTKTKINGHVCVALEHMTTSVFRSGLTLQLWLMKRAKLPHFVASMMVSWSTRNM